RIPLQPVSPSSMSAAAVEIWICRVMVSVSLSKRYGRADIEDALLRVVLALLVPRLGVHHPELVPQQEIESVGVHPHVLHLQAEPEAEGIERVAVLIDPDAVVGVDLAVAVDVLEDDVARAGAIPMGIRVHGRLVLEHADRVVQQAARRTRGNGYTHPFAGGTLPCGRSRGFVP